MEVKYGRCWRYTAGCSWPNTRLIMCSFTPELSSGEHGNHGAWT
jgi:hypothetical protein